MKKVLLLVLAVMMVCGVAMAAQTDSSWFHSHGYTDSDSYVDRYSEFQEEQGAEIGIGYDVVVYEFEGELNFWGLDAVEVQQRYDFNNHGYEIYGVVKANAWRPIKKLLGL